MLPRVLTIDIIVPFIISDLPHPGNRELRPMYCQGIVYERGDVGGCHLSCRIVEQV